MRRTVSAGRRDVGQAARRVGLDAAAAACQRRRVTRHRSALARLALQPGDTSFVPPHETVELERRQHPAVLAPAAVRTVTALLALSSGAAPLLVVLFAAATAWWARERMHRRWRTAAAVAGAATVVLLWLSSAPLRWALAVVLVWLWLAEDVVDWWQERLVVTDQRIYRHYGWLTRHAPSMALLSAVFVDVSSSPWERLFGSGTLRFDSAAQRDAPLSRFAMLPDVEQVHRTVLALRAGSARPYPR